MVSVCIDRELSSTIEDHTVVDDDFVFCEHGLRSFAVERVNDQLGSEFACHRCATRGNGSADTLLSAWEYVARAATCFALSAGVTLASDAASATAIATITRGLTAPHQRNHAQRADT
jgi:hypothetical protein